MRNNSNCAALVCLLAVCACNRAFGILETQTVDATFFDAPTDAPYTCPPFGTPPRFSADFQQLVLRKCPNYTVSITGRNVLAKCDPDGDIEESTLDSPSLAPATGFPPPTATLQYETPRLPAR